jgi:hypothetical protein
VSHGYAVAYGYGVEFKRGASCGKYAFFDGCAYSLQVNVAGHDGRVTVRYADEWFGEILVC